MLSFLPVAAAIAGACGLIVTIRTRQWGNTAAAAYAAAAVLMAVANLSGPKAITHLAGWGIPKGCVVGETSGDLLMLSCPVPVTHVREPPTGF